MRARSGSRRGIVRLLVSGAAALAVAGGTGLVLAGPANAAPTTRYVSPSAIGTDASCASPGYNSIQAAVTASASGDTVVVCSGTYHEQVTVATSNLTIEGSGATQPVLEPTAVTCDATVTRDDGNNSAYAAAALEVKGVTGVTVEDLGVNGVDVTSGAITCGSSPKEFWGIWYNDASGELSGDSVTNIAVINNDANGVVVNNSHGGTVTISGSTFTNTGKNAVACIESGTSCAIDDNSVTGNGAAATVAQNGILVAWQATGTVSGNAVRDYDSTTGSDGIGVLLLESSGVTVIDNTVTDCQVAISLQSFGATAGSAMSGDIVEDNTVDYSTNDQSTWETNSTNGLYVASFPGFEGANASSISVAVDDNLFDGPGTYVGHTPVFDSTPAGIQVGDAPGVGYTTGSVSVGGEGNLVENWTEDVSVAGSVEGSSGADLSYNDFSTSQIGVLNASGSAHSTNAITPDAADDWWGCAGGPNTTGCTTTSGSVLAIPWLATLTLSPVVQSVSVGSQATVTATLADETSTTVDAPLDVSFATSPNVGSNTVALSLGQASFTFSVSSIQPVTVTATLLFGPTTALVASNLTGTATVNFGNRLYGSDAIGTAIAVSEAAFPKAGSAGAVVLARDDFFSDGLAGGPLAAANNGPLLLTEGTPESQSLDPRTLAEIERVLPKGGTVFVLGGVFAISLDVDATLQAAGYQVVREAGANEYDTAYLIALALGSPSTVFEATGTNFYDALSAEPAAIAEHAAILLTDGSKQSFETGIYLLDNPGVTRYAIGGPLAAAGADPGATPIYGQDLFGTSAAVASTFFPDPNSIGAATAADFPDALTGGVFMMTGGRAGPVLLVNPQLPLPSELSGYLESLPVTTPVFVFGGPLAISDAVMTALEESLG